MQLAMVVLEKLEGAYALLITSCVSCVCRPAVPATLLLRMQPLYAYVDLTLLLLLLLLCLQTIPCALAAGDGGAQKAGGCLCTLHHYTNPLISASEHLLLVPDCLQLVLEVLKKLEGAYALPIITPTSFISSVGNLAVPATLLFSMQPFYFAHTAAAVPANLVLTFCSW
jgi:hypothetical protein